MKDSSGFTYRPKQRDWNLDLTKEVNMKDERYLEFDPFSEDRDVSIECRKVSLVTLRKEQPCAASWLLDGSHVIAVGARAKKETAKVDGQFGSCYCCLPCLDRLIQMNK